MESGASQNILTLIQPTASSRLCIDEVPYTDTNNRKCGNKYLAWAFVEAANFARRYDEPCRKWYERKAAKTSKVIATKALACKLAKAAWYLASEETDYESGRVFPQMATTKNQTMKA